MIGYHDLLAAAYKLIQILEVLNLGQGFTSVKLALFGYVNRYHIVFIAVNAVNGLQGGYD